MMNRRRFRSAICTLLLFGASVATAQAQEGDAIPVESCNTEAIQAMAPADTTVSFAAREQGGLCRIVGYVTTQNPGPNRVLFTLGLPSNFTGRYVYLGVGGAAGQLPALRPELLEKGYALSGSDGGSGSTNWSDFSFRDDPAKTADFLGRGVHVVAQATQQIVRRYYRKEQIHRYISGCSGGGQMGLTNALRFGSQDFDGFVVGATPLVGKTVYGANAYSLAQYLQKNPDAWISPELLKRADAAILAAYDTSDGAKDGIIADARNIDEFDINILRNIGFTPPQIEMFDRIRLPQTIPAPGGGTRVQPGYPVTDVELWSKYIFGSAPPPWPGTDRLSAAQVMMRGAPYFHVMADTNIRSLDPSADYATLSARELARYANELMGSHPFIPDPSGSLARFAQSGAKMIIYHGVDDEAMSYLESIQFHREISQEYPNAEEWLRLYTLPGLRHCRGGPGTSNSEEPLIEAVASWVEDGKAPDTIIARRVTAEKGLERTFLLCPEPARAFLTSRDADAARAENWECRSKN